MRADTQRVLTVLAVGGLALALTSCGHQQSRTTAAAPAPSVATAQQVASTQLGASAQQVALAVEKTPQTPFTSAVVTRPLAAAVSATPHARSPLPFATPEAAMRYLADAYNRNDVPRLRKVTTPEARDALLAMRDEAVNLRLRSCEKQPAGDYLCRFAHDYPASLPMDQREGPVGAAEFLVAPADRPGWYMTVLQGCG